MCCPKVIAASLGVSQDSSRFFFVALLGFPSIRDKEKGLDLPFHGLHERDISFITDPNGGGVRMWVSNLACKFYIDPTVNTSKIIILPGQVWVNARKREFRARDISLTPNIILKISMVRMCKNKFQTDCSNFTTVQRLTILRS